jgi:hypothetical protein
VVLCLIAWLLLGAFVAIDAQVSQSEETAAVSSSWHQFDYSSDEEFTANHFGLAEEMASGPPPLTLKEADETAEEPPSTSSTGSSNSERVRASLRRGVLYPGLLATLGGGMLATQHVMRDMILWSV